MEIVLKRNEDGTWDVSTDGKLANELTYDEMLGLVTQITMPEKRHCLRWLKTPEQIKAGKEWYEAKMKENNGN